MSMMKRKPKTSHANRLEQRPANQRLPFIEHLYELRKRLFYVALSVGLWAAATYFVQQRVVAALLRPAHNQQFIYTSVGGGIDFLFRVCMYVGLAMSIPVIVYLLKYLEPLVKKDSLRFVGVGSIASGLLALAGMAFGYFIGLPAALHFLLHQFTTSQIHPLLTIQSYMGFVTIYLFGSALLFQLPLLLILINRIKPLKPKKMLQYERWVILLAFIGGGLMNPSPRLQDQLLLSGPVIATYQLGIFIVWFLNRKRRRSPRVARLLEQDANARRERLERFQAAQRDLLTQPNIPLAAVAVQPVQPIQTVAVQPSAPIQPIPLPIAAKKPARPTAATLPGRPGRPSTRYLNDFVGQRHMYGKLGPNATPNT
jgi:sec-independent protein translocase protein TatC